MLSCQSWGTWLQVLASQHCGNPVRGNKWFRITKNKNKKNVTFISINSLREVDLGRSGGMARVLLLELVEGALAA